jgi:hypothetical protein
MSNKRKSTQILEGIGAIRQIINQFGKITNNLTDGSINSQSLDPTAAILENVDSSITRESINGQKYELIKGIFDKHVENEKLAEAYTLLALDALKKFDLNFEQLFETTENNISFSELGIAVLNSYRPSTSQIGARQPITATVNVARHIIQ